MSAVPSNAERAWEYGLNVRMENTVCVCYTSALRPAKTDSATAYSADCKWGEKTRGQTTPASQACSSTVSSNGAASRRAYCMWHKDEQLEREENNR